MEKNWLSKTNQQKWYAPHQRFSIRKYHFGAASVLLGVALALTGGAEASANTADTGSSTTPSSAVEATSSTTNVAITSTESTAPVDSSIASATTETMAPTETATTTETVVATPVQERVATINYTVEYQDETGAVVATTAKSVEQKTTEDVAIAVVTEVAELPAGYELTSNTGSSTSVGVIEGGNTKVVFKVVKQVVVEKTNATESTTSEVASSTTPSSTAEPVAPATTTPSSTAEPVAPATTTATSTADAAIEPATTVTKPTTVEEAKVILKQVVSEAAVLATEGERLVATTENNNVALQTATTDARSVATQSTEVLADSLATFEKVSAQIDAVRARVEALAVELRKISPDGK